jgi:glycosyltransferase involved in cell wall biosynthesis
VSSASLINARIGIDASRAISTTPTGTEGYSYHLLHALLPKLRQRFGVTLYFRQAPDEADYTGVALKVMGFPRLWTHIRLSWEMLSNAPDLLFVPAHVLPLVHPRRSLVTVHDLGYRYFPGAHPAKQRLYLDLSTRWNVHTAAHILVDSNATRDAVIKTYRIPPARMTVAYPGYDSNLSHEDNPTVLSIVKARYGIEGDYILHIGRLQPRKNLQRLIRAFQQLLPQHPQLQLVLAGPTGWLSQPIREYVQQHTLEKNVLFPGYIAEKDKAALISGAKIFAYPSLYEGFGFPALEAQACGTPLLTSTTSSLPEVAGDGAIFVNPEDDEAMIGGLQQLLENELLRQKCITRGYDNVRRFSWEKTAQTVLQVMEAMI